MSTTSSIHLIERDNRFERVEGDIWESGFWAISEIKAQELVGGSIYFHEGQTKPSFFGGQIIGHRVEQDGDFAGRIIFRFRFSKGSRDVQAGKGGWSQEKKIVT